MISINCDNFVIFYFWLPSGYRLQPTAGPQRLQVALQGVGLFQSLQLPGEVCLPLLSNEVCLLTLEHFLTVTELDPLSEALRGQRKPVFPRMR